eukprot:UN32554
MVGRYRVIHNGAIIKSTEHRESREKGRLPQNRVVSIVQIKTVGDRIRGRLKGSNKGWISIQSTDEKTVWAELIPPVKIGGWVIEQDNVTLSSNTEQSSHLNNKQVYGHVPRGAVVQINSLQENENFRFWKM